MNDTPKIDLNDPRIRTLNAMELAFSQDAMRAVLMVADAGGTIEKALPFSVEANQEAFLALMVRPTHEQTLAGAKRNDRHENALGRIEQSMESLARHIEDFRAAMRGIAEVRRTKLGLMEAVDFEARTAWAEDLFRQADDIFNTKPGA